MRGVNPEDQDAQTVMGRKGARAAGTLNWAQGRACWGPWVDPVRLPWHLLVWEDWGTRQDWQGGARWWLNHKCQGEGPQHVSWYFLLANMGCQNRQQATGLAWLLCVG